MAYSPDPTDQSQPTVEVATLSAAAEFRALKSYIAGLTLGNQNAAIYRKNILHNGNFNVRQRLAIPAGAAATDIYVADRWKLKRNFSANINGGVLVNFTNLTPKASDHYLTTGATAAAVPAVGQYLGIEQQLEFLDVSHLMLGMASARTVTFSGWISTLATGIFPIYFQNGPRTRSYVTSVTIAAAGVWQYFSVVVPLDTAGAWTPALDTDAGLIVGFGCANGATFQAAAANTWAAGDFRGLAGQLNAYGTIGWITLLHGLQLEIGAAPTAYERLPFELELAICQRYYERSYNADLTAVPVSTAAQGHYAIATANGVATNRCPFQFKTRKRVAPTMTFPVVSRSISAAQDGAVPTLLAGTIGDYGGIANINGGAGWAVGQAIMFASHADADF